jgi:DNA polymerase III gamma/tau subunit
MPDITSYSDWYIYDRPTKLDEVYGQDSVIKALRSDQKTGKWSKAYFFQGQYGSGKTTIAKIVALNLACKSKDSKTNEPCLECPSCRAIIEETWDRDAIYINGTQMSADDVRKVLEGFKSSGAFRDAAKVLICDETQDLSPEATNSLLQITENPRKGFFFLFTAMDKLKGKLGGALESRCKKWKLKTPSVSEIYLYLLGLAKRHQINEEFTDQAQFDSFMKEGLELISQNCEYSLRKASQMLEQCVSGRLFTKEDMKAALDVELEEDMILTITDLANGKITPTVVSTITGKEYNNSLGLISKILGDASVLKACGTLGFVEEERWKERSSKALADAPHFDAVRDTILDLQRSSSGYIPRGLWEMQMSKLVERVKTSDLPEGLTPAPSGPPHPPQRLVRRRPAT